MSRVKVSRMSYNARRLLGQLCACENGKGMFVDRKDAVAAAALDRRSYTTRLWIGNSLIAIATDAGRKEWDEFKNGKAKQ